MVQQTFSHDDTDVGEHQRKAKKATAVAVFGTFIEYYDFSVFGYVAATISVVFFPSDDPIAGLLNTLLVFGSAFVVRPLGAIFFGWLGDRRGRRSALVGSVVLMSVAAGATAMLPPYAQIGMLAPILLVVCRMLQGFSTGGEIGGAASYIREWAPEHKRSFYISFLPSVGVLGKGLAAGAAALAATFVDPAAMETWGWRIPFLIAIPLGILCLILRLKVEDSPEFTRMQNERSSADSARTNKPEGNPFSNLFRFHGASLSKVFSIALVQNIGTYIGTVYVAVYFSTILGYSETQASTIVLIAVVFAALLIPVAGLLGNRFGSRRTLLIAYIGYVVVTIPSFMLMNSGSFVLALVGLMAGMLPYALCQTGTYAIMPEFFPVEVRHTGVAFGHSVGAVIGGAGAPYLATWLIDALGTSMIPAYMLVLIGVLGLLVLTRIMNTNSQSTHLFK